MIRRLAGIGCVLIGLAGAVPAAQSDLDELMGRVLLKRDDNWKKLQQYVLEERESMDVTALDGKRVYGFAREYQWFPRDGFFVKSPLTADGVKIGEDERRRQEARWLAREQFREKRRAEIRAGKDVDTASALAGHDWIGRYQRRLRGGAARLDRTGLRLGRLLPRLQVRGGPVRARRARQVRRP